MKQLFIILLTLSASQASAQDLFISGGYATNTPYLKFPYEQNSAIGEVNGSTRLDKVTEKGFSAGLGMLLKTKPAATFGARVEAGFEHYKTTVNSTKVAQVVPFQPQTTFSDVMVTNSNYLRLGASVTYAKIRTEKLNFQADLGYCQVMMVNGWNQIGSYANVHASAGIGFKGILLKAGTDIGLNNMLRSDNRAYKGYAKRYFVGLTIYPRTLIPKKKKTEEGAEKVEIYDPVKNDPE